MLAISAPTFIAKNAITDASSNGSILNNSFKTLIDNDETISERSQKVEKHHVEIIQP